MGFASALTYDFEVYSGAQKRWLEVSSDDLESLPEDNRIDLRGKYKRRRIELKAVVG